MNDITEEKLRAAGIKDGLHEICFYENCRSITYCSYIKLFIYKSEVRVIHDRSISTGIHFKTPIGKYYILEFDEFRYAKDSPGSVFAQKSFFCPVSHQYYFEDILSHKDRKFLNFLKYENLNMDKVLNFFRIWLNCSTTIKTKIKKHKNNSYASRWFDVRELPMLNEENEIFSDEKMDFVKKQTYGGFGDVLKSDVEKAIRRNKRKRGIEEKTKPEPEPEPKGYFRETKEKYLYLMKDESIDSAYKIGISQNPKLRESTLQAEKPSIKMVGKWSNLSSVEKRWHDKFKQFRMRGEWFKLSGLQVQMFCKMNTKPIEEIERFLSQC